MTTEITRVSRTTDPRGSTKVRSAASTTVAVNTIPTAQSARSRTTSIRPPSVVALGATPQPLHVGPPPLALQPVFARTPGRTGGTAHRRDPQRRGQSGDETGTGDLAILGLGARVGGDGPDH